jgi:hypothetical protein
MPRSLVYGPKRYQGLGIDDPWASQIIAHLHCILRHCTRHTITGLLHNANMENLTLELGSAKPFWDLDYTDWSPLATKSWITSTWHDLKQTPLTLKDPMTIPTACRSNDVFIIDAIVAMHLDEKDLISLNETRMYKQVLRLSNMTSADGKFLLEQFLNNSSPTHPSAFEWPRCYRPSPNQISLWRTTILACFSLHQLRLHTPLGAWTHDDPPQLWEWWNAPSLNCLFQSLNRQWLKWNSTGVQYTCPSFARTAITHPSLPADATRATVSLSANGNRCKLINTGQSQPPPAPPIAVTTIHE